MESMNTFKIEENFSDCLNRYKDKEEAMKRFGITEDELENCYSCPNSKTKNGITMCTKLGM